MSFFSTIHQASSFSFPWFSLRSTLLLIFFPQPFISSWGFLNLRCHQSEPESALNCILYTPAMAKLPTEFYMLVHFFWLFIPSFLSPRCEPYIKLKPWDDFFLSQLWLLTIIQQPIMSPHFGNNPSQMCAPLIKFPIRTACLRRNFMRDKEKGEKIMCVDSLVRTQQGAEIT